MNWAVNLMADECNKVNSAETSKKSQPLESKSSRVLTVLCKQDHTANQSCSQFSNTANTEVE